MTAATPTISPIRQSGYPATSSGAFIEVRNTGSVVYMGPVLNPRREVMLRLTRLWTGSYETGDPRETTAAHLPHASNKCVQRPGESFVDLAPGLTILTNPTLLEQS